MDQHPAIAYELYPSPKRVRVMVGGTVIADSRRAILLRRDDKPPVYYFPRTDLREGALVAGATQESPYGLVQRYDVHANGVERAEAAWSLLEVAGLKDCVALRWEVMDAWFEEEEEVYVHPRDPRKRIDIAAASSLVRVRLGDEVIAESRRPTLLFETGLVTRYYLPKLDVCMALLEASPRLSYCPYKGEARYYSIQVGERRLADAVWYYRYPSAEALPIAGLLCFYQERLSVEVDGQPA